MRRAYFYITSFFLLFTQFAVGQSPSGLRVDQVSYKGVGCPRGSVATTISPDQTALSFLFSNYVVTAPARQQASVGCTLRFQLTPPVGYRLRVVEVDYRGFQALPAGARAVLNAQVQQQVGSQFQIIGDSNRNFSGPINDNFLATMGTSSGQWSGCAGGPVMINLSSRLGILNQGNAEAQFSIDSGDLSLGNGATFQLAWTRCQ